MLATIANSPYQVNDLPPPARPPRRSAAWAAPLFLALVAGAVAGGLVGWAVVSWAEDEKGAAGGTTTAEAIVQAVARARPAVVTVVNELPPPPAGPGGIAGGAGFIVDERGFIVTNEHLVRLQGKLSVVLNDGEVRPATLVSHDAPFTDVAVLRIRAGGLVALPVADSAALRLGETVIAIGSPDIDYRGSVSTGVVSGLGRAKLLEGMYRQDLIQTDAAINAGNSGGPLLNLRGEAIGIVSFRDIGAEDPLFGISFAISSRTFAPIVQAIIRDGSFPRPYLGVEHLDLDAATAQELGLSVEQGALVLRVTGGSPAERAGIRVGDVLLRLGSNEISEDLPFLNALAALRIGERVSVQLWREGRLQTATVEVTRR